MGLAFNRSDKRAMTVLFLGYGREETSLITELERAGCVVDHTEDPMSDFSAYDLVVSYGYRHIIRQDAIDTAKRPILNLHIAFLPWNRGAHPLFWSAHDGTPSGVTIHAIDAGVDTGPICFQKRVEIDPDTTFADGYSLLREKMEELFLRRIDKILSNDLVYTPQYGEGTVKRVRDLPDGFMWSEKIDVVIDRLSA